MHPSYLTNLCVRVLQEVARQAGNIVEYSSAGDGNPHNAFPRASDQCSKQLWQVITVHETPADLNYCLTTSVCVKCMHSSYTFNTKHVSSKTVKHAANHEMHVLVAHLLQPSSG